MGESSRQAKLPEAVLSLYDVPKTEIRASRVRRFFCSAVVYLREFFGDLTLKERL
jgi:hypothetical protein